MILLGLDFGVHLLYEYTNLILINNLMKFQKLESDKINEIPQIRI